MSDSRKIADAALAALQRLDAELARKLTSLHGAAAEEIAAIIRRYAGPDGMIPIHSLPALRAEIGDRLDALARESGSEIARGLIAGAGIGLAAAAIAKRRRDGKAARVSRAAIEDEAAAHEARARRIAEEIAARVQADRLNLSQRLWRIDAGSREIIAAHLNRAVIEGWSAQETANRMVAGGLPVPPDVRAAIRAADAERIARDGARALLRGPGNPLDLSLRVARTETNRAHHEAFEASLFEHPEAVGTRFRLSPHHPRLDVCDMHARANLYGLGPGVYPKGKNPFPAHPNTFSYTEPVFRDEVSDADRQGRTSRTTWLRRQPVHVREAVLGGRMKRAAFDAGLIDAREVHTPWRVIRKRLEKRQVDINDMLIRHGAPTGTG